MSFPPSQVSSCGVREYVMLVSVLNSDSVTIPGRENDSEDSGLLVDLYRRMLEIPLLTSASVPQGPNGPLMPEIHEAAPHAVFVSRKGEINAWDNVAFQKAVRSTGKKTLIIAGVWTSVCVAFPALDAKAQGFNVYAVLDASGDPSEFTSRITLARLAQAGVVPTSANAVLCEFQQHWNRPNNDAFAALYADVSPNYGAVIESFQKAQEAAQKA